MTRDAVYMEAMKLASIFWVATLQVVAHMMRDVDMDLLPLAHPIC